MGKKKRSKKKNDPIWDVIPPWGKYLFLQNTDHWYYSTEKPYQCGDEWAVSGPAWRIPTAYAPRREVRVHDSLMERP